MKNAEQENFITVLNTLTKQKNLSKVSLIDIDPANRANIEALDRALNKECAIKDLTVDFKKLDCKRTNSPALPNCKFPKYLK